MRGLFGFLGGCLCLIVLRAAVVGSSTDQAISASSKFVDRLVNPAVPLIGASPQTAAEATGTESSSALNSSTV